MAMPLDFSAITNMKGLRPGATAADLATAQQQLGIRFPKAYSELLMFSNGALFENGLSIYPAESIAERHQTFDIEDYLPGCLLIGDDSGGTGVLLSLADGQICLSGLGDLNPSDLHQAAPSLQAWINAKFAIG